MTKFSCDKMANYRQVFGNNVLSIMSNTEDATLFSKPVNGRVSTSTESRRILTCTCSRVCQLPTSLNSENDLGSVRDRNAGILRILDEALKLATEEDVHCWCGTNWCRTWNGFFGGESDYYWQLRRVICHRASCLGVAPCVRVFWNWNALSGTGWQRHL